MSKKTWWAVALVSLTLLLAGCGTANSSSSQPPAQQSGSGQNGNPQGPGNISPQQRQQFQQEFRAGTLVSLTADSVTMKVQRGGADVGTNATYKLTASTVVRKDRSTVSTSGQVPDLTTLGLKAGFFATLRVNAGNVVSIQFNSDGSQPQGPRNGNWSPPNNGSAPNQNGSAPNQ